MAEGLITWIGNSGSESLEDSIVGHEAEHCVFSNAHTECSDASSSSSDQAHFSEQGRSPDCLSRDIGYKSYKTKTNVSQDKLKNNNNCVALRYKRADLVRLCVHVSVRHTVMSE